MRWFLQFRKGQNMNNLDNSLLLDKQSILNANDIILEDIKQFNIKPEDINDAKSLIMDNYMLDYISLPKRLKTKRRMLKNIEFITGKKLSMFTNGKSLLVVYAGVIDGYDLTKYLLADYDESQIHQIHLGLSDNLNIKTYDNKDFSYLKMGTLRLAQLYGVDVSRLNLGEEDVNVIWYRSGIPHDLVFFGAEEQFKDKFLRIINQNMYNPSGGDKIECINK